jgi:hypothetical protein
MRHWVSCYWCWSSWMNALDPCWSRTDHTSTRGVWRLFLLEAVTPLYNTPEAWCPQVNAAVVVLLFWVGS